jgi:hypothetical protein
MESMVTADTDKRTAVEGYIKSFEERDVGSCLSFFTEDAVIHFGPATFGLGRFRGTAQIEKWHRERFTAGGRVVKVEEIKVDGDQVRVKAVFTSPRLKAVRLDDFRGTGTFLFEGARFKELKLGLERGYRFHI